MISSKCLQNTELRSTIRGGGIGANSNATIAWVGPVYIVKHNDVKLTQMDFLKNKKQFFYTRISSIRLGGRDQVLKPFSQMICFLKIILFSWFFSDQEKREHSPHPLWERSTWKGISFSQHSVVPQTSITYSCFTLLKNVVGKLYRNVQYRLADTTDNVGSQMLTILYHGRSLTGEIGKTQSRLKCTINRTQELKLHTSRWLQIIHSAKQVKYLSYTSICTIYPIQIPNFFPAKLQCNHSFSYYFLAKHVASHL